MKRLLFVLILIPCFALAQIPAYYPSGKRIEFKYKYIQDILDTLGISEDQSFDKGDFSVYFKKLSKKPLFVLFLSEGKAPVKFDSLKLKSIINQYNYNKYINSYSYYHDLKDMIKRNTLTYEYASDVFGKPDITDINVDGSESCLYKNYNCKITFRYGIGDSVLVLPFKSILQHKVSVTDFEVAGGDYSIGFNIGIGNHSNKSIKYTYISVTVTNPVNDVVGKKTVKAVGPIRPYGHSVYEFENVVYSKVAEYLTLDNIKIEYMDGTTNIIPKAEIEKIKIMDWEEFGQRSAQ